MKVGDLLKYASQLVDDMDRQVVEYGLVIQLSKTGHTTTSAQVLFNDGEPWWVDTSRLVVINESG